MDKETYEALAQARIDRAKELLDEAQNLLEAEKYINQQIIEHFML